MTPHRRFLAARVAYVAIVLLATLTQLHLSPDLAAVGARLGRALSPSFGWRDAIDGLRNVALFAGLGAVWVVTSVSGKVGPEIRRGTLAGLVLSATAEGLQLFSPVRTASLVDVATNTLGALAGALAVAVLIFEVRRARGARSYLGLPTSLFAGSYGLATLCEAMTPLFGPEPLPSMEGGPLARWHAALSAALPLSFSEVRFFDLLLFAPAGFLLVMLLAERGWSAHRAWRAVAGIGAGIVVAAELVHGFLGLPIRWEAAGTHALAVGLGAWTAHRALGPLTQALRGGARARAAIFAYVTLLVLWGWRPLLPVNSLQTITAQFTPVNLVPLRSLAERVDAFSALHVVQQFLLYLPLGGLLAVWPLRQSGRRAGLAPAIWLAAVIEGGHLVIEGRTFDVTNTLIGWAGLAIGWIVMRRSGFTPYGTASPERG